MDSISFSTVDYNAHINQKLDFSINIVVKSMTIQKKNTLHYICELEPAKIITTSAMSVQNPQPAGYHSTGNRRNFLYVEVSTAMLADFSQSLSPLNEVDKRFDIIPIDYQDAVMYIDP